ncbi:hypothetical protein BH11ACT5_BH11ACT5_23380 [soil metagenome]
MTDQTIAPTAPVENVGRGATFALLAIPAAIIVFIIVGGVLRFTFAGIASIVVPYIAISLYTRGAGAPISRKGWGPFIAVAGAAVIVGTFTGIIALAYARYLGHDGLLSGPFLRTVGNQIASADGAISLVIGLGIGAAAIVSAIRGPRSRVAPAAAPAAPMATTPPPAAPPVAPSVAPPAPPVPNQPSAGILLNGKPIDPTKK